MVGHGNSPPTCQTLIAFFSVCFDIVNFATACVMSDMQKVHVHVCGAFLLLAISSSCCVEFCTGGRGFGRGVRDYLSSLRGWVCVCVMRVYP